MLKPGGVIGVRTPEHGAALMYPPDPLIQQTFHLYRRQKERVGQNAEIGRSLRAVLREAGFARVVGSASVEVAGTPEATRRFSEEAVRILSGAPWTADIVAFGWIDEVGLEQMKAAWRAWGEHPDALRAVTWCEAVGWVE